jgi:ectoine hydrolase
MSVFERSEYLARLAATKARMAERDLDLLFVTTPENICYLTGYAGWSFYVSQALLVSPQLEEPILILRDMDTPCASYSAFLKKENVVGYPEEYIGGDKHAMGFVAQVLRERCGNVKRIGYEPAGSYFPIASFNVLQSALSGATFVDSALLVNWLRTYKSAAEVEVVRQAADLASRGMETALQVICPGVRECDAAAEINKTLVSGAPGYGGSVPASFSLCAGARTAAPHIAWTDEPFQAGQLANLELGGSRHQYHAGLSRSFYLGTPPASLVKLSAVVVEGLNTALASVRPGKACEEVEAAWRGVISRAGYEKKSRIGYSIGLGFSPAWIENTASLQAGDRTVLTPGMTFHMICGMWKGDDNFILSETFTVSANGADVLTRAPRRLLIKT